jgi:hypothetical protein
MKYKTVCAQLPFTKVIFERIVFCGICNMLYFIYYEVGLLQYSKIARSKIGTPTVDIFNSSILISQNCIRSERVAIISIVIFCLECF